MKRVYALVLSGLMVIGGALPAQAIEDSIRVYYEVVLNDRTTYSGHESEWNQYMINTDITFDNVKIGLDSSYGSIEDPYQKLTTDFFSYKIIGGFAVYNQEKTRLDIIGGYCQDNYEFGGNYNAYCYKSLIAGADLRLELSDRMWVDANYVFGINPVVETHQDGMHPYKEDMVSMDILNLRLNINLSEETALTLGYISEILLTTNSNSESPKNIKNHGYTIGVCYRY